MLCEPHAPATFEVRFRSLLDGGCAFAFICDSGGRVDLDAATERQRNDYLFARAMVGREYAAPQVCQRPVATLLH
jgi:hypothetical protein